MSKTVRLIVVLLFAGGAVAFYWGHRANSQAGVQVGETAPDFTLPALDGGSLSLAQFRGQVVVVNFWATWCPLCRALEPKMAAAQKQFGDKVRFIAVAVAVNESPASIKRRLARDPYLLPVLWDANGAAVRAFDAPSTSYVVTLDAAGKVRYTGSGEDQDLTAAVQAALRP